MNTNTATVEKQPERKAWDDWPETQRRPWFLTFGSLTDKMKYIMPLVPEYSTYLAPFFGRGELVWHKAPVDIEYLTDIDEAIIKLHTFARDYTQQQLDRLKKMNWTGNRDLFNRLAKSSPNGILEYVYRQMYLRTFAMGGTKNWNFRPTDGGRTRDPWNRLEYAHVRLAKAKIVKEDFRKTLSRGGPDSFAFIDPPYFDAGGAASESYYDEGGPSAEEMADAMASFKGKTMLVTTGNPTTMRAFMKGGFYIKRFKWMIRGSALGNRNRASNTHLRQSRPGWIVTNYNGPGLRKGTQVVVAKSLTGSADRWLTLLVPDPEHIVERLDVDKIAGVMATKDHSGGGGGPFALVNYDERLAQSWGVVEMRKAVQFPSGARAVEVLGDKVCPNTAAVFKAVDAPVWFHPLDLLEVWDPHAINHPQKAVWTTAYINDLEDSAFLHIEPGGEKDDEGKTTPRSLRHFPVRDADGKLDLPHLRNAISRIPQAKIPGLDAAGLQRLQDKARRLLEEQREQAAKAEDKDLQALSDEELAKLMQLLGEEYHRAEAEGGGEALEELMEAKLAVLAELKRRGLPLPEWAQQKAVDVAKGLSPKEEEEYQAENKRIAEAKQQPGATRPHPFRAAKFTHPNGHPRCAVCGSEETVGGWCNDPRRDAAAAKKADSFEPLANVKPQQPKGVYADADEAIKAFATDEALQAGVAVEPLIDGKPVVVHRSVKGGAVTVRVDGAKEDECKAVAKCVEKELGSSAVLVGSLAGDKVHVTDMLYWDAEAMGTKPWHQRAAKRQAVFGRELAAVANVPGRVVHGTDALKAALKWAVAAPGSAGAVLKLAAAPYQQGGRENEAVVKAATQVINALVYSKDGDTLQCAVGPLPEHEAGDWQHTVEHEGKRYAPVGSTSAKGIAAEPGDVIRVQVAGFESVDTPGKRAITWTTPSTKERVRVKPSTVADVRASSNTKKSAPAVHGAVQLPEQLQVQIIQKSDDELRFVLGVVLEPNDGGGEAPLKPDAHSDIYSAVSIREACHLFLMEHGRTGVQHQRELSKEEARICENYIMPVDGEVGGQQIRKGTWMLGARILSDEVWQKVKSGELNAWSIDGEALRTPAKE